MTRPSKGYYTENEAAGALGLTIEELRALVKTHIVRDENSPHVASANYQPSDLLALRLILSGLRPTIPDPAPLAEQVH